MGYVAFFAATMVLLAVLVYLGGAVRNVILHKDKDMATEDRVVVALFCGALFLVVAALLLTIWMQGFETFGSTP